MNIIRSVRIRVSATQQYYLRAVPRACTNEEIETRCRENEPCVRQTDWHTHELSDFHPAVWRGSRRCSLRFQRIHRYLATSSDNRSQNTSPVRVFLCDGVVFEDQGRTWRLSSISLVLHKNKTTFQSFREEFLSWLEKVSHIWLNELLNNLIQTLTSILEFFRISWKPRGGRRFGLNINDPVYRRSIEKYSYLVACIIEPLMYFQPSNRQFRRWLKNSSGEITIDTANTYQVSYHGCYVTS